MWLSKYERVQIAAVFFFNPSLLNIYNPLVIRMKRTNHLYFFLLLKFRDRKQEIIKTCIKCKKTRLLLKGNCNWNINWYFLKHLNQWMEVFLVKPLFWITGLIKIKISKWTKILSIHLEVERHNFAGGGFEYYNNCLESKKCSA